jgi:uncharacterized repeat protein (TIGR03803 family)
MFTNFYPAHWSWREKAVSPLAAAVVALAILLPIPARAQQETVLYSFTYGTYDLFDPLSCPPVSGQPLNEQPHAGLLFYKGALYGTTPEGGAGAPRVVDSDRGMVFRVTQPASGGTPWNEQTLHSFQPEKPDGLYPCSSLIEKNGVLYGSTLGGTQALGTIFALVPPATGQTGWTENELYNFIGGGDGQEPFDGLTMGNDGSLYGVTAGGAYGDSLPAVFQLTPSGNLVTLLNTENITCKTGTCLFNGDLLLDSSTGALFGTNQSGGAYGYGNVFQLTPSSGGWIYDDLYDFTGGADGATPNGGLVGGPGDLFGTTQGGGDPTLCEPGDIGNGCGVLFELRQLIAGNPYTLIVQHSFLNQPDGSTPTAGLFQDAKGTLWGTTTLGGSSNLGTIFELYPDRVIVDSWHYLEAYSFAGGTNDGAHPQSSLTADSTGALYGTTNSGGSANEGTVFRFGSDQTTTKLTSSLNPDSYHETVQFTATVTPMLGGPATGLVTLEDGGSPLATATLAGGKAIFTVTLPAGTYLLTAVYAGNANFANSTSAVLTETVDQAATTTLIGSSLDPSKVGESVTFSARPVGAHLGAPTGKVAFKNGTHVLATVTIDTATGLAKFTTGDLLPGTYSITATYGGDHNFKPSVSKVLKQVVE